MEGSPAPSPLWLRVEHNFVEADFLLELCADRGVRVYSFAPIKNIRAFKTQYRAALAPLPPAAGGARGPRRWGGAANEAAKKQ